MSISPATPLYIGIGGHVVALDRSSGSELWRAPLKRSSFVTVHHAGDRVYAGAAGELFCLDAATGNQLWRSELVGLGIGLISFPGSGFGAAVVSHAEHAGKAV